jgi:DNA polymerase-1
VSLADVKLHLVDSIDDVLKLKSWLGERRPFHALAFDTETTGLIIGTDYVRLIQVGDGMHGWAIPYDRWSGVFQSLMNDWDGDWLAHNAKFEAAQEELSRSLTSGSGGWTWATVPTDYQPYWTYGALDPVLTYKVYEHLWPQVQADCPDAFALENEVSWIIERMERYGAHVNVPFASSKLTEFTEYVESAAAWIKKEYGVSAGSNAAIVKILSEAGYEFTKATASGAVALDKDVLDGIDHPLAQTVLKRRQIQKLASTYLLHFAHDTDEDDLIHPSINVLGARTSRMSMSEPNLQNLPRKNTRNPAADVVRNCITTRYDPGGLMMCDFDQVEMRMLASMAKEQSMIAAFKSDTDFFVALARMVYEDESIIKSDSRRQVIKNAGYATIYGAGVPKFSATAGISLEQGHKVRKRWDELFPGVVRFQQDVIRTATQRRVTEGQPYVRCPITRRKQVADAGKEYALVNFLIQGAAAAVLKRKIIELDNAGLGPYMVVPVHDEIILDLPADRTVDAAKTLVDVMNDDSMFDVPLSASVSWGQSWGSKEEYK